MSEQFKLPRKEKLISLQKRMFNSSVQLFDQVLEVQLFDLCLKLLA